MRKTAELFNIAQEHRKHDPNQATPPPDLNDQEKLVFNLILTLLNSLRLSNHQFALDARKAVIAALPNTTLENAERILTSFLILEENARRLATASTKNPDQHKVPTAWLRLYFKYFTENIAHPDKTLQMKNRVPFETEQGYFQDLVKPSFPRSHSGVFSRRVKDDMRGIACVIETCQNKLK